jgi:hypothetical protein
MKRRIIVVLLLTALFVTTFASTLKPARATAFGVPGVFPFNNLFNAVTLGGLVPGDHIHIATGYMEALPPGFVIPIPNLWIIGAPLTMGPRPSFDLAGNTITIAAPNVFIWGIDIWDSTATSPFAIGLTPAATGVSIQRNTIRGSLVMGSIGISIPNSAGNLIANNMIRDWDVAIDIFGPGSSNNIVKLNDIDNSLLAPSSRGVQVSGGAGAGGPNQIFWNDIIGIPSPPFSGLGQELWDPTPANPINVFDDLAQPPGNSWGRGNFESSWGIPPAYMVLGAGNGYFDLMPNLGNTPITGDTDLNGQVDIFDAIRLAVGYGRIWCTAMWDPRLDFNNDGSINIFDAVMLALRFSTNYPPSPAPT